MVSTRSRDPQSALRANRTPVARINAALLPCVSLAVLLAPEEHPRLARRPAIAVSGKAAQEAIPDPKVMEVCLESLQDWMFVLRENCVKFGNSKIKKFKIHDTPIVFQYKQHDLQ